MRQLCAILCLLVMAAGSGIAQENLSQEEMAQRIFDLAYTRDESASDVQLGYSGRFGTVWISLEIEGCLGRIQQYSDISEVHVLVDFLAEFELNNVRFVKGRDYSKSVSSVDGFSQSIETNKYYTYSTTADSDRIVANITFEKIDGSAFEYLGVDYKSIPFGREIEQQILTWVPLQRQLMPLVFLNPKNEKQLQDLVFAIDDYRRRFCTLTS